MAGKAEDFTLIAEQIDPLDVKSSLNEDSHASQEWSVMIHVFKGQEHIKSWTTTIKEPLSKRERSEVAFYLNEILRSQSWPVKRAQNARELIQTYQRRLFTAIRVRQNWQLPAAGLCSLNFEVLCNRKFLNLGDNTGTQIRSIHSLHWELLEERELWAPEIPVAVIVRRRLDLAKRIPGKDTTNHRINPVSTFPEPGRSRSFRTFNVLLVVARDVTRDGRTGRCDPYGPTAIPAAVLKIQERLRSSKNRVQVALTVVRPGSLKTLKAMLKHSSVTYNVVHFDMHGRVSVDTNHAELQFNINGQDGFTENWVDGRQIAEAMQEHKIRCVVIGACFSAYANAAANANLALLMVKRKVSNVVAMSFKMNDKLSEQYFSIFYDMLFIKQYELSEAAQRSRAALSRQRRQRYYYGATPGWKEIEDWFVPVVYSSGAPFFARNQQWDFFGSRYFLPIGHWHFWGVSCIFLTLSVSMDLKSKYSYLNVIALVLVLYSLLHTEYFSTLLSYQPRTRASTKSEQFGLALEESLKDKTNILRLENELNRTRKVYFYAQIHHQRTTPKRLLDYMLPIWERTGFVDSYIRLDCSDFQRALTLLKCRLYEWYIKWHDSSLARKAHDPHLMIIVDNVHELYQDPNNSELFDAKLEFEDWIRRIFPSDEKSKESVPPGAWLWLESWWKSLILGSAVSKTCPYLILTGRNVEQRPNVVRNQLTTNFARVPSLRYIGITDYQKTDPSALST